ncbi:hypothetical protein [Burkholderia gladioli]|uniref:hypothetical protein n=1 Tax=Burkholderia gladioli TaxID=28095 RepID=UPI00163F1B5A|nr:hypothetical protein [Burkholderia gladioli]
MTNNTTAALTDEQRSRVEYALDYMEGSGFAPEADILRALLTSPRAAVPAPAGWKLVPIEPTQDMLDCWWDALPKGTAFQDCTPRGVYGSMLDAAPAAPVDEISPDECATDVYKHGKCVGYFDIPKHTANALCAALTTATGIRIDWHYVGGRVAMKALLPESDAAQAVAADGAATDDIHEAFGVIKAAIEHGNPTARAIASSLFVCAEKQRTSATTVMARAAVSPPTAEPCAHDYVRSDSVCTECGEKAATADERAAFPTDAIAYRVLRRNTVSGEWVTDDRYWQDGPPSAELIAETDARSDEWRIELAFSRASQAAAPAEAREPIATFDDGLKVYLDSWTGGRHEAGSFGEVTLRFTDERHTTVREYRAKDIVPADAHEPVATLHDDGHYVWNPKVPKPEGYDRAGWKMAVYAGIPADAGEAVASVDETTFKHLFYKHGGPVDSEGWCINESGLRDFLADLAAAQGAQGGKGGEA